MSQRVVIAQTKWTVSKAQDSYGYNICTLYVDGDKVARTCGGGYDMVGTVFGNWIAKTFPDQLRAKIKEKHYGLVFVNPNFDPGTATVPGTDQTVKQQEDAGKSFGLERLRAAYARTTETPNDANTNPYLDGACGMSSMEKVFTTIGGKIKWLSRVGKDGAMYEITLPEPLAEIKAA